MSNSAGRAHGRFAGRKSGCRSKVDTAAEYEFFCGTCEEGVGVEDDRIKCHDCKRWVHFGCTSLTKKSYDFLKSSNAGIQWICPECVSNEGEPKNSLESKVDSLMEMIRTMGAKIQALEKASRDSNGQSFEERVTQLVDKRIEEAVEEKEEKEKRKLNLILVNVPESTKQDPKERHSEDLAEAKMLFEKVCAEEIEIEVSEPVRLGQVNLGKRPRMLRVKVKNEDQKKQDIKTCLQT